MSSNCQQAISLLLFIGGGALGIALMWFWGFGLIEKFINRKG